VLATLVLLAGLLTAGTPVALAAGPSIPSWVRSGLTLRYGEDDDGYCGASVTDHVTSVAHGKVSASTTSIGCGSDDTHDWQCNASGSCDNSYGPTYQFWIDPSDPLGSLSGQKLPFQDLGSSVLRDPDDRTSYEVTVLHYHNAKNTFRITYCYQRSTGRIIEADEVSGIVVILWYDPAP
jgi:hypothetical protein